jgi:hypothetical protein
VDKKVRYMILCSIFAFKDTYISRILSIPFITPRQAAGEHNVHILFPTIIEPLGFQMPKKRYYAVARGKSPAPEIFPFWYRSILAWNVAEY